MIQPKLARAICPLVYRCLHEDDMAVSTQHLLGEDKTNLVQPPFHFNQCASKNQLRCIVCVDFEWIDFSKLDYWEYWGFNSKPMWLPDLLFSSSQDLSRYFLKMMVKPPRVCGIHGLFELVFHLTTNKYLCQSVSVYLACLSAITNVFSCALLTYVTIQKPTAWQPWYFFLLDTFFSSILSLISVIYSQITLELLWMNSGLKHFFDYTCTLSRHRAKSLRPYLKGRNLHWTREITLHCLCVLQKSQWSAPQLWWAAQRNQQVSIRSLHLAHKHHCFMRGTKTYFLIFLDLSFKVWNKY